MTNHHKKTSPRYSPEVRERAVRLVFDHAGEYTSQWAAIESIAAKIGCAAQALSTWVKQAERDQGLKPGPLLSSIGNMPPAEAEDAYYASLEELKIAA